LRDRETDKEVSARDLKNSERNRVVEFETWLECEQDLTDESILMKKSNEE
jgi:hypothetical protein